MASKQVYQNLLAFDRFLLTLSDGMAYLDSLRDSWLYERVLKPIRYARHGGMPSAPPPKRIRPLYMRPEAPRPLVATPQDSPERAAVIAEAATVGQWYHTIRLPHDVYTPGLFDHRPALHLYGLPDSLAGKRCLDVATFDGFWAFEMESRGGEVSALDLPDMRDWDIPPAYRENYFRNDWGRPTRTGFEVARDLRGSKIVRHEMSVYNLAPETLDMFDIVYCGDLLIHLRDPNLALQRIRSVTREYALFAECVQPLLAMFPLEVNQYMGGREDCVWWWFKPSTLGLMMLDAGFRNVEPLSFFKLDYPDGRPGPWRAVFRAWV